MSLTGGSANRLARAAPRWRLALVGVGGGLAVLAVVLAGHRARQAASSTWPPFVLVAGLLAIGALAQDAGVFDTVASALAGRRGSGRVLLVRMLGLVAVVTVVLNLDTAAAFLTPVVILVARRRRADERPFLYGALLMTNAASLLLPGSNLTNLLVVAQTHQSARSFAAHLWPAWIATVCVTAAVVIARAGHRSTFGSTVGSTVDIHTTDPAVVRDPFGLWFVVGVIAAAGACILVLSSPAVPVVVLAAAATAVVTARGRVRPARIVEAVDPAVLAALFAVAVALGTLARSWDGPARLTGHLTGPMTAVVAALATVVFNNLPATMLFTGAHVAHPTALVLGLDVGPNLAVTGSLSALVWFKAARTVGAEPDWRHVTRLGLVVVPASLIAAGMALAAASRGLW